jgi:outer membrane protein assembly factor BamB
MKRPCSPVRWAALLALLIPLVTLLDPVALADWPVVRGDNQGSGVSPTKLPEQLEELWTYKATGTAGFEATAVVAKGIVYVGDSDGSFHAVRLADGKPVWAKAFEDSGFKAGAAFDGDRIYVGDLNGAVRCLAVADGSEIWKATVESEVYAGPTPFPETVLVTSESGSLTAFNKSSGAVEWQFRIDAPLRCTPTAMDDYVMLAGCDSLLHAINIRNGKETYTVPIDGPTGATAAMSRGRAYFGTEGGTFFAIDVANDASRKPAVAWSYRDPKRGQPIRSAAAVTEKIVVFGTQGKAVSALDPKTGEEKWKLPTRARVDSSPVIAADRVIAATTAGKLYLLDLATGDVKWESDFGGDFTASPAVANGRVIIGNMDGTLYCLGSKKSATEITEKKK